MIRRGDLENEGKKKIPRPMNAFMVFASDNRRRMKAMCPDESNKEISIRLGNTWKSMTQAQKEPFYERARDQEKEHRKKYPNYVYCPGIARQKKKERLAEKARMEAIIKAEVDSVLRQSRHGSFSQQHHSSPTQSSEAKHSFDTQHHHSCGGCSQFLPPYYTPPHSVILYDNENRPVTPPHSIPRTVLPEYSPPVGILTPQQFKNPLKPISPPPQSDDLKPRKRRGRPPKHIAEMEAAVKSIIPTSPGFENIRKHTQSQVRTKCPVEDDIVVDLSYGPYHPRYKDMSPSDENHQRCSHGFPMSFLQNYPHFGNAMHHYGCSELDNLHPIPYYPYQFSKPPLYSHADDFPHYCGPNSPQRSQPILTHIAQHHDNHNHGDHFNEQDAWLKQLDGSWKQTRERREFDEGDRVYPDMEASKLQENSFIYVDKNVSNVELNGTSTRSCQRGVGFPQEGFSHLQQDDDCNYSLTNDVNYERSVLNNIDLSSLPPMNVNNFTPYSCNSSTHPSPSIVSTQEKSYVSMSGVSPEDTSDEVLAATNSLRFCEAAAIDEIEM